MLTNCPNVWSMISCNIPVCQLIRGNFAHHLIISFIADDKFCIWCKQYTYQKLPSKTGTRKPVPVSGVSDMQFDSEFFRYWFLLTNRTMLYFHAGLWYLFGANFWYVCSWHKETSVWMVADMQAKIGNGWNLSLDSWTLSDRYFLSDERKGVQ